MKKKVLITAIGSFSAQAAIAACRREGYDVVGCDIYPAEWVANSLEVDQFYQAPYATEQERYLQFLEHICRLEQIDFLVPLTDVEIDALQSWRAKEEETKVRFGGAVLCISDYETVAICRNKKRMEEFLKERSLCQTIPGKLLSQITQWRGGYPAVMKPFDGRSSQELMIVENEAQFVYAKSLFEGREEQILVQPKIKGGVVTTDILRDPRSGFCVCLARRELLRTSNGAGTSVQVFHDPKLESQCRAIAEAIGIRGCVNFEWIESQEGWYFLECNPRFSGGLAFSCLAGYDMAKNHLRCFAGGEIERMGSIRGQYFARRYQEYRMREEECE